MSAIPSYTQARINLDPRNKQKSWLEDIEVKLGERHFYFSVEVEHDLDIDGNVRVGRVFYDGKAVVLPSAFVELFERVLEDEK